MFKLQSKDLKHSVWFQALGSQGGNLNCNSKSNIPIIIKTSLGIWKPGFQITVPNLKLQT